jgi:hypothetical protein
MAGYAVKSRVLNKRILCISVLRNILTFIAGGAIVVSHWRFRDIQSQSKEIGR